MGQRRQHENNEKERYNEVNKEIKNDCRKAKENYTISQCNKIGKMGKQLKSREMHNKIKLVTSRTKRRNECSCIEDKSGKIFVLLQANSREVENIYRGIV